MCRSLNYSLVPVLWLTQVKRKDFNLNYNLGDFLLGVFIGVQDPVDKDSLSHKQLFLGDIKLPISKRIHFDPFVGEEWFLREERETRWKDA